MEVEAQRARTKAQLADKEREMKVAQVNAALEREKAISSATAELARKFEAEKLSLMEQQVCRLPALHYLEPTTPFTTRTFGPGLPLPSMTTSVCCA